jgi:hypothetical protein
MELYVVDPKAVVSAGASLAVKHQHGQVPIQGSIMVISKSGIQPSAISSSYNIVPFTVVDVPLRSFHFQHLPSHSSINVNGIAETSAQLWEVLSEQARAWYALSGGETAIQASVPDIRGPYLDLTGRGGIDALNAVLGGLTSEAFVVVQGGDRIKPSHDIFKHYPVVSNVHICVRRMEHDFLYHDINNVIGHSVGWSALTLHLLSPIDVKHVAQNLNCLSKGRTFSHHPNNAVYLQCEELVKIAYALHKSELGIIAEVSLPPKYIGVDVHGEFTFNDEVALVSTKASQSSDLKAMLRNIIASLTSLLEPLGVSEPNVSFKLPDQNSTTFVVWVAKPSFFNGSYIETLISAIEVKPSIGRDPRPQSTRNAGETEGSKLKTTMENHTDHSRKSSILQKWN